MLHYFLSACFLISLISFLGGKAIELWRSFGDAVLDYRALSVSRNSVASRSWCLPITQITLHTVLLICCGIVPIRT
jgi:hypothetical protein